MARFGMAVLIWLLAAGTALAESRVALVIGNSAYATPSWKLTNPVNDARLMEARLKALGFQVETVTDASRAAMAGALQRFGAKVKAAGPDDVALFFYAGHAAQSDGVNFLIPVDATAATMDELRFQSPALQFLLADMAEGAGRVNIVILDACRDVPLEQGARGGRGGLADEGRRNNLFIAYAAAPGRTASDGGGANSPFSTELARALANEPQTPISLLFEKVNAAVYQTTRGGQSPEFRNGLVRAPGWSLASARAAPGPVASAPTQAGAAASRSAASGSAISGRYMRLAAINPKAAEAAEAGDWRTVAALGQVHLPDRDRPGDMTKAMLFMGPACEYGNTMACVQIGLVHKWGYGAVPKDLEEAKLWYNKALAIDPNDGFAKGALEDITGRPKPAARRAGPD